MSGAEQIYASRVLKLPLVTPDGDTVGRIDDLVIGPPTGETAPILLGLVAGVGRRRIFVTAARVKHFETSGVVLASSALDLHPFKQRTGELLLTSLLDRPVRGERVLDLSMRPRTSLYGRFGVAEIMLGRRRALGLTARMRRVPWEDVADLSDLDAEQQSRLLEAMDPEEADPLRRLLLYEGHTAGGLMTPEPLVLLPEATVAEALARLRAEEVPAAVASCVFVTQPPTQPPTGIYLGALSFQRLLREPPSTRLADLVDGLPEAVHPNLPEIEVAERLAAYNLLAVPVCDESGFLLGAVTVDDVLDRTLPVGWRTH